MTEERCYLICKYGGYYRPGSAGYTDNPADAGRYTEAEAIELSHPNGPDGPRDGITYVHEDEVPYPQPQPLNAEELAELDSYGQLWGGDLMAGKLPTRVVALWTREILYGRAEPHAQGFASIITRADRR